MAVDDSVANTSDDLGSSLAALATPGAADARAASRGLRTLANAAADGQLELLQGCAKLGSAKSVVKLLVSAKDAPAMIDALAVRPTPFHS